MRKIAIITGASSGIGQQISIDLSKSGFECILLGRDLEKLKSVQAECPNSKIYSMDLNQSTSIQNFLSVFLKDFETLRNSHFVLVNNAGIVERNSFENTPIESWIKQFKTNLLGPVELTLGLMELIKAQTNSKIINISSTLGLKPIPETSAYSSSKAAVNNWTQSLALELSKYKISVNAICPGIVETPLQSFYETEDKALRNTVDQMQPLGRVGTPKDISDLVLYLSSENCSWMTGSILTIDGGISLG